MMEGNDPDDNSLNETMDIGNASFFTTIIYDDENDELSTVPSLNSTTNWTFSDDDEGYVSNATILPYPSRALLQMRDEPWALPLLVLSSVIIIAIIVFEAYVLYKSCGSRRHLFLGQMLMMGLLTCSLLGYAHILEPRWFLCAITRAGAGLAYALVFATLFVKCVFLINLHSGMYLNSAYQGLLLFFAFGVQVAITTQWLIYQPAEVVISEDAPHQEVCRTTTVQRVQFLTYAMLLMLMVVVVAVRGRSLRENNREVMYIGVTIALLIVVWVSWISVLVIFDRRYEDPAQGFGLACTSLVVFSLVFVPKAIQLSMANRKNESTNGSQSMVFAPSFLHLQPHAVLPGGSEGTMIKQSKVTADYCRGYPSRFWNTDYPTFYQMEPQMTTMSSDHSKSNVTFLRVAP